MSNTNRAIWAVFFSLGVFFSATVAVLGAIPRGFDEVAVPFVLGIIFACCLCGIFRVIAGISDGDRP